MIRTFNQFVFEASGFSNTVAEYAELAKKAVLYQTDRYSSFNFRQRYTTFTKPIKITQAFRQVSQESSKEFPIDEITIHFKIVPIKWKELGPYSASYVRRENQHNIKLDKDRKADVDIVVRLNISTDLSKKIDLDEIDEYVSDMLHHELTHAFNDYRDPNFMKKYGLGFLASSIDDTSEILKSSAVLNFFFTLLYVLTDAEINAMVGERKEFKSLAEFDRHSGTRYAIRGMEYYPEEYYEVIKNDLGDRPYWPTLDREFGRIFVDLYRRSQPEGSERVKLDPKILRLEKSAGLAEVLEHFEPYIKSQSKKLFTKLAKKLTQEGKG